MSSSHYFCCSYSYVHVVAGHVFCCALCILLRVLCGVFFCCVVVFVGVVDRYCAVSVLPDQLDDILLAIVQSHLYQMVIRQTYHATKHTHNITSNEHHINDHSIDEIQRCNTCDRNTARCLYIQRLGCARACACVWCFYCACWIVTSLSQCLVFARSDNDTRWWYRVSRFIVFRYLLEIWYSDNYNNTTNTMIATTWTE